MKPRMRACGCIRSLEGANLNRIRQALAIAAKAPLPGRVKTRLLPDLTPEEAATLYTCFLRDTLEVAESVPGIDIVVSYWPLTAKAQIRQVLGDRHRMVAQRGRDLGERIRYLLEDLLGGGYHAACVLGSDSPNLPGEYLEAAFEALDRSGDRVALGPASDGGYYLIGAKTSHPALFKGIGWSGPLVFEQTIQRARELQIEVSLLPEWYDVDTVDDLERLMSDLNLAGSTPELHPGARNTRQYL